MDIIFICGSFESGKDGVGDYVRTLSLELESLGHQCHIIALKDKFVTSVTHDTFLYKDNERQVLRIPFQNAYHQISELVRGWIKTINPDIISIQYVPFSFHHKGVSVGLPHFLKKVTMGYQTHIMFHEMWVGISKISPIKHKILGFFQRRLAQQIVSNCKPQWVSTSNALYQLVLKDAGIDAHILPLFSNIPKVEKDALFVQKTLLSWGISTDLERNKTTLLVIFGTLYPQANIEAAITEQLQIADTKNQSLKVVSIGRIGDTGKLEFERLSKHFANRVQFILYGEVDEYEASQLLQMMNVAISCTPAQHIGKSGVYALLKLHNLPVILPTKEYLPEYDAIVANWYETFSNRPSEHWSVEYIAQQLQQQLMLLKNNEDVN